MDSLLIRLGPICKDSHALLSNHSELPDLTKVNTLRETAQSLNHDIAEWQQRQSVDFKPTTIGHIPPKDVPFRAEVGYWPSRVDIYFDFYVAAVWNVSRLARCFLLNIILKSGEILDDSSTDFQDPQDLVHQVEDIIASIPYHLTMDVRSFIRYAQAAGQGISNPERPAGGFLLMHSIYAVSCLPTVPLDMQNYMRNCLTWIGSHMGIGQASLLAQVRLGSPCSPCTYSHSYRTRVLKQTI